MTAEAVDYPVPWWLWAIIGVVGILVLTLFALLAYVGRPA